MLRRKVCDGRRGSVERTSEVWAWDPPFPAQDMVNNLGFCLV